jgi:hypothetical protein
MFAVRNDPCYVGVSDTVRTCRRATPEPGLDVVDVAAADDTAAVLFQRMLAER